MNRHSLYTIRDLTGSQCNFARAGLIWSVKLVRISSSYHCTLYIDFILPIHNKRNVGISIAMAYGADISTAV